MLKKALTIGAIYAMSCGVSFAKPGAIDIAELSLKETKSAGVEYLCSGDTSYAKCHFQDIDTFAMQIKNFNAEFFLSDSTWKQVASADLKTYFDKDIQKFMPKRFKCTTEASLDSVDLQSTGKEVCIIESDLATITLDIGAMTYSKTYKYKTMTSVIYSLLARAKDFTNQFENVELAYYNRIADLRKQRSKDIREIEDEQEILMENVKRSELVASQTCSCQTQEAHEMENDYRQAIAQNERKKAKIEERFEKNYDAAHQEYQEKTKEISDELVEWLKKYDLNINEVRVNVQTRKLAENTFDLFTRDSLASQTDEKLTKKQQIEKEFEKRKVYSEYYSSLETAHVVATMFIKQSPHLKEHLKRGLIKVVSDHAKLFDPNSHRRSVKIIVTPLEKQASINIGTELQKVIESQYKSEAFLEIFFNTINQYDVKSVKYWPNY